MKAVFHNQYNTPIGIYSDSNVFQEFQNQTKGIMPQLTNQVTNHNQNSAQFLNQNQSKPSAQHQHQQQPPQQSVKGANSLSMKMLNMDLNQAQSANKQPSSVFDLKYSENANFPSNVVVPKGFKSVQAPVALPPEQRHAPMRKEYQVQHVKQNWIEPK